MKELNLIQGSPEWLAARTKYFTASEANAMMGESKYQSRSALLKQKATGIAEEVDAATQARFDNVGGIGTTKPVTEPTNPAVDKGILLRVCSIDAFKLAAEDVGYRTITIPYAELYTALQTGVAEGVNGLPPVACYTILKDVLKYYYQTNYFVESESYLMSKKTWDKLNKEEQEIIVSAARESELYQRTVSRDAQERSLAREKLLYEAILDELLAAVPTLQAASGRCSSSRRPTRQLSSKRVISRSPVRYGCFSSKRAGLTPFPALPTTSGRSGR